MENVYAFDIETSGLEDDAEVFVISVCNCQTLECQSFYSEHGDKQFLRDAIAFLENASKIVSFNGASFDFRMIHNNVADDLEFQKRVSRMALRSYDLLTAFAGEHGYFSSLESFTQGSLEESKKANGAESINWWKDGRVSDVVAYCEDDARLTARLWNEAHDLGRLVRVSKAGKRHAWVLPDAGCACVHRCITQWKRNPPDLSWMTDSTSGPDMAKSVQWAVSTIKKGA